MNKGDLVLVPFPFTDLSGSKFRPALVLYSDSRDVILAFISTQFHAQGDLDVSLYPDPENGLKKTSYIKLSKLVTLDYSLIAGKLGSLSEETTTLVNSRLRALLKLD